MMSSEGVQKLTEYLAATRRQAELSISSLNEKILDLQDEIGNLCDQNRKLADEKKYLEQLAHQLKSESSNKSRLQERDDWKGLVESIQKDRARLQDECLRLEMELEQLKLNSTSENLAVSKSVPNSPSKVRNSPDGKNEPNNGFVSHPSSPTNTDRILKMEYEKLATELQVTQHTSKAEINALTDEVSRLRKELNYYKKFIYSHSIPPYSGDNSDIAKSITHDKLYPNTWFFGFFGGTPMNVNRGVTRDVIHV